MSVKFRKQLVADERYEAAGVLDANNDGNPDIVSGSWWYEGPEFKRKHRIGEVAAHGEYFDDFCVIPMDVNGDGLMDYVTCGWFGKGVWWRENPGDPDQEWTRHVIAEPGPVETARAWDVDGDGEPELVPNAPHGPLIVHKLVRDANGKGTGEFQSWQVYDGSQGHGLGFGDITGNGRGDFVLPNGWLEAPPDPVAGQWVFHQDFDLGGASMPIIVADVNGDGLGDIIVGRGHDYGLSWLEQRRNADGSRTWVEHPIDPFSSQYHDLHWVDIDGDGQCELVTGKRYRAHCGNDPGGGDDYGIYYFKWNGESFSKEAVIYGPPRETTGIGLASAVADLNGNGLPDIVAPGKDGLYVFWNEG